MRIAYQGEPGAYSEAAALRFSPSATTLPCTSFEDVFAAVDTGKTTHGILPIENSIGGSIHRNYDLLLEHELPVVAEVLLQVAGTIQERSEIKGHVRSLSAEGRMSAVILMALPVAVGLVLGVINAKYLLVFVNHPVGIAMTVLSCVLFVIGGFWMNRTVKIKF